MTTDITEQLRVELVRAIHERDAALREVERLRGLVEEWRRETQAAKRIARERWEALARDVSDVLGPWQDCGLDVALERLRAADRAEVARLRERIETMPPWPEDGEPLDDEQLRALRLRWSTGPERYQADADALIATVERLCAQLAAADTLAEAVEALTDAARASQGRSDDPRRTVDVLDVLEADAALEAYRAARG